MSVNEKFADAAIETVDPVRPAAKTPAPGEGETQALGIAIGGFQEAVESRAGRIAATASKLFVIYAAMFIRGGSARPQPIRPVAPSQTSLVPVIASITRISAK